MVLPGTEPEEDIGPLVDASSHHVARAFHQSYNTAGGEQSAMFTTGASQHGRGAATPMPLVPPPPILTRGGPGRNPGGGGGRRLSWAPAPEGEGAGGAAAAASAASSTDSKRQARCSSEENLVRVPSAESPVEAVPAAQASGGGGTGASSSLELPRGPRPLLKQSRSVGAEDVVITASSSTQPLDVQKRKAKSTDEAVLQPRGATALGAGWAASRYSVGAVGFGGAGGGRRSSGAGAAASASLGRAAPSLRHHRPQMLDVPPIAGGNGAGGPGALQLYSARCPVVAIPRRSLQEGVLVHLRCFGLDPKVPALPRSLVKALLESCRDDAPPGWLATSPAGGGWAAGAGGGLPPPPASPPHPLLLHATSFEAAWSLATTAAPDPQPKSPDGARSSSGARGSSGGRRRGVDLWVFSDSARDGEDEEEALTAVQFFERAVERAAGHRAANASIASMLGSSPEDAPAVFVSATDGGGRVAEASAAAAATALAPAHADSAGEAAGGASGAAEGVVVVVDCCVLRGLVTRGLSVPHPRLKFVVVGTFHQLAQLRQIAPAMAWDDAFITKPLRADTLFRRVARALGQGGAEASSRTSRPTTPNAAAGVAAAAAAAAEGPWRRGGDAAPPAGGARISSSGPPALADASAPSSFNATTGRGSSSGYVTSDSAIAAAGGCDRSSVDSTDQPGSSPGKHQHAGRPEREPGEANPSNELRVLVAGALRRKFTTQEISLHDGHADPPLATARVGVCMRLFSTAPHA